MSKKLQIWIVLTILIGVSTPTEFSINCRTDSDCHSLLNSYYKCDDGVCANMQLQQSSFLNIFGLMIILIVSGIAIATGIGGGAIFTSIFILIDKFDSADAIPLSQISIFSSAVTSMLITMNRRHPLNQNEFLINYPLLSKLIPVVVSGSIFGVMLNQLLPPFFVFIALCYFLISTTVSIYKKAKNASAEETVQSQTTNMEKEIKMQSKSLEIFPAEHQGLSEGLINKINKWEVKPKKIIGNFSQSSGTKIEGPAKTDVIPFAELMIKNKRHLIICGICIVLTILTCLIRGGKGMSSVVGLESCSFLSFFILILAVSCCSFLEEILIYANIFPAEYPTSDNNNLKMTGIVTGIIGSTLGLGGGIIINPFLLQKGFPAPEAFSISTFVVLVNSLVAAIQFMIAGAYTFENTVIILMITSLGSYFGTTLINRLIEIYKKNSILLWLLFGLLVLSSIVQPTMGILKLLSFQKGILSFGSIC